MPARGIADESDDSDALPPERSHDDLNWTQEGEWRMLLGEGQTEIGNSGGKQLTITRGDGYA